MVNESSSPAVFTGGLLHYKSGRWVNAARPVLRVFLLMALCAVFVPGAAGLAAQPGAGDWREISWEDLLPAQHRGVAQDPHSVDAPVNPELEGAAVRIFGFVVPLEWDADSRLSEFLLVPYFGACIHAHAPPENQVIRVRLAAPLEGVKAMDTVFVHGPLAVEKAVSAAGNSAYAISDAVALPGAVSNYGNLALAFLLAMLCGVSLSLGWLAPNLLARVSPLVICLGVSFAAGVLLSLGVSATFVHFSWLALALFLSGVCAMLVLEFALHARRGEKAFAHSLQHTGHYTSLAVAAHNLPECFVVFSAAMAEPMLGLTLGIGMMVHNIPLGFSMALSLKDDARHRGRCYALFAGLLPPLLAVAAYFLLRGLFSPGNLQALFALAGGMMSFIALAELLPTARQYGRAVTVLCGFAAGLLFMCLVLMFS